ncbi:MAG: hypothetical protein GAK40_00390 [Burkholderia plantarii]|nr:MAG: hypothetical protein GAK40_00390 [Burkholderia plantarii]
MAAVLVALLAGCATQQPDGVARKTGWMRSEVADTYLYAYPLVMMDLAREAATGADTAAPGHTGINTLFAEQALPGAGEATPPLPSVDTLDASAWLDVAAEPVIVVLPDTHGRYLDARVLDMWTNVLWSTGTGANPQTGVSRAQTIAFVGPDFHGTLPAGIRRISVPARHAWLGVRVRTSGGHDLGVARQWQRAVRVVPLSAYGRGGRAASSAAPAALAVAATPAAASVRAASLDAAAFFSRFARALRENPALPADPHVEQMLDDLGVTPGEAVAWHGARLAAPPPNLFAAGGWRWIGSDAGHYGEDYVLRAYAAATQPGAGTRDDETLAVVTVDGDGRPLNGANRYVLHFPPHALPPVRAFWSLTSYTLGGALPGERGASTARRSIGTLERLPRNRDGSLDIVVSAASPGRERAANWLSAPRADFQLALRLYAPKPGATDGSWRPPAVWRE